MSRGLSIGDDPAVRESLEPALTRTFHGGLRHSGRTGRLVEAGRAGHPSGPGTGRREATDPAARLRTMPCGLGGPGDSGVALGKRGEMSWPELL
ncbi:hypothetical protein [Nonomuraea sp. NPDC049480]|uniref:hypothetical protein n=1 Tax=Nonomuraea sp. NPDC049480 TaxID=3364353 RepID=UPI0037B6F43A